MPWRMAVLGCEVGIGFEVLLMTIEGGHVLLLYDYEGFSVGGCWLKLTVWLV
jgi:hypothetical protein